MFRSTFDGGGAPRRGGSPKINLEMMTTFTQGGSGWGFPKSKLDRGGGSMRGFSLGVPQN